MADSLPRLAHFIDGRFVPPASGSYIENIEPATGRPCSLVPDGDARDVDAAVAAAERAFPAWAATPAAERSRLLLRIADLIDRDLEKLALAESIDTGKPLSLARSLDIPRASANFRFFATAILHTQGEMHATDSAAAINYTLRQPRGVAGLVSPWNLPLYLLSWKVAPAIACGNTAVAKPSELTPTTAQMLCELCVEAGLPTGVLNVVHGLGGKAGQAITAHPRIGTISFTGGTVTGRRVAEAGAAHFKKVSLELGGKNPNLVFDDADLEAAVAASVRSSFANQGQICLCGSRILVQRAAYQRFLDGLVAAASKLNIGDPLEAGTDQGAIVSRAQLEKVRSYVELARQEGGTIVLGGGPPERVNDRCAAGYFYRPTIITGLSCDCRVNREEIFGPVVTVAPFDTLDEAVGMANGTDYGLSATVWTRDLSTAHRAAERIQAGTVWVNCWLLRDLRVPFGGMKQSGVGREGGEEAIRFFTEAKNVCVKL